MIYNIRTLLTYKGLEIFRLGPVTHCRPEPPCVVKDIPKRETSINELEAPFAYQRSVKCMKTSKNQFYKDGVRFYKYK